MTEPEIKIERVRELETRVWTVGWKWVGVWNAILWSLQFYVA